MFDFNGDVQSINYLSYSWRVVVCGVGVGPGLLGAPQARLLPPGCGGDFERSMWGGQGDGGMVLTSSGSALCPAQKQGATQVGQHIPKKGSRTPRRL